MMTDLIKADRQLTVSRLVTVVTFLLIFSMAARTPLDTDMWWHLRAGEEIVRSGRLLEVDIFSFTRSGLPWTNPYWLAQVGMALSYRWLGFLGLGLGMALFATLSMALVFWQCEGPVFLKAAALLLGSVVASVVWSARPQLLSLVWTAMVGLVLYRYKWRGQDVLWALPLIFILWANTHGGYPLGIMLIGAMMAGETLNHLLGIRSGPVLAWRQIARLGVWGIACGLAVLLNPNGLDMWRLPFLTVNMSVLQQFIPEWASPDFHQVLQQTALWLLLAVFAAVSLAGRRMDGSDLVTILIFALMALVARRNFGPFALVAVPVLTRYAAAALEAAKESSLARAAARDGRPTAEGGAATTESGAAALEAAKESSLARAAARDGRPTAEGGAVTAEGGAAALEAAKESSLARAAARDGRPTAESGAVTAEGGAVTAESGAVTVEGGAVTVEGGAVTAEGGAARKLAVWLEKLLKAGQNDTAQETARARRIKKVINLALVALLGLAAIVKLYVVTQPAFVGYHIASGYPVRAARWLVENRGGEKLFNEYNWGGYLQWSLPGIPTFVDGRTDLFGDEVVGEWITVVQAGEGWEEILARYGADLVMVEPGRPLVEELRKAGWQRLYEDAIAVIYARK